jgi:hypothetical protein
MNTPEPSTPVGMEYGENVVYEYKPLENHTFELHQGQDWGVIPVTVIVVIVVAIFIFWKG